MMIVADNLQVTSRRVAQAIERRDAEAVRAIVTQCLKAGADAIDINPGPLTREPEDKMTFLVEAVQSATDKPLLLDTTNPRALAAGLKVVRNPAIINGFSLEPARLAEILPLAVAHDVDIIGYLLYPDSRVPVDEDECLAVAAALLEAFEQSGLARERLIIDPVVAPLIWDNGLRHNRAVLAVVPRLADLFGFPVRTIAGISNLTTGPAAYYRRIRMEQTFVPMLAVAGLNMALMNMRHAESVQCARACDILLRSEVFAWDSIEMNDPAFISPSGEKRSGS
jgi:5-methyltetrahydrofolate corrinoid/iron sulfur protein methyltransferase